MGKSFIVNVLGLSKFFYFVKVLRLLSWVFSRVNFFIWFFIWGFKIEIVSRNICYLLVFFGGFNIVNLEFKCIVFRFIFVIFTIVLLDDFSFFLCKYYIGRFLVFFKVEWVFLRDNLSFSVFKFIGFYDNCLEYFRNFDILVRSDVFLSIKVFYFYLLKKRFSFFLFFGVWVVFLGFGLGLKDYWFKVCDVLFENFKNDFVWVIIFRVVKVRDFLKFWGYIDFDRCVFCNVKEIIDYCFFNCF